MASLDYVVIGAGYAGLSCKKKLDEKGFNTLIFDMRGAGGELKVFEKLEVFREGYEKYIQEVNELIKDEKVEIGTVIKSKPVIVSSKSGLRRFESRRILLCTGAADIAPAKLNVLRKRISGIYTLDQALRSLAENVRIGKKILFSSVEDDIVNLVEKQLEAMEYDFEVIGLGESIKILGTDRLEAVEIDGVKYSCDTFIVFSGREPFNPLKLRGTPVGNVSVCTYDYRKVEENVKNFLSKF